MLPLALFQPVAGCPRPWENATLGYALFFGGLLILLLAAGGGALLWRRYVGETGDTAQRVVRNSAVPLLVQIATRGVELTFLLILYRELCASAIGSYELAALLVVLFLGSVADFGLTTITTREVARNRQEAPRYFRAMLRLRTLFGLLAIPIALAVPLIYRLLYQAGAINQPLSSDEAVLIGILVLTLLPAGYSSAATALFQAYERLQIPALLNLVTGILSALLRALALLLGYGIAGVAIGSLAATIAGALLFWLALRRVFGQISLRGEGLRWRPLLAEGWPLMLNSLLLSVFFRFDSFIIAAYYGAAAVAVYGVTYKFINLTQILPPIVVNALFPLLSRRAASDQSGFRHAYFYTLRLLLLLAIPLSMAMSLLAEPLVTILASQYPESVPALAIIVWYLPFSYINGLTQFALIAQGKQRVITKAFGITAVFNLGVNLALIPVWGIEAAAAVTIASEIVLYLPLRRALSASSDAPPLLTMAWRPALASLPLAATVLALRDISDLLALLAAVPVYVAGLLALGTFTTEDRLLLQRVLRRGNSAET